MGDRNPIHQVQFAPRNQRTHATPLVLIHDGGGTTFAYFTLETLRRNVWAIHNPRYSSGKAWDGGMDEMARHYIGLMKKAGITGSIIIGGWSLGGYVALVIARMLAADTWSTIKVTGLLLIDSPYLLPGCKLPPGVPPPDLAGIPDLVLISLANCEAMLETWELPTWDKAAFEGRDVRFTARGRSFNIAPGNVVYKPLEGDWKTVAVKAQQIQDDNRIHQGSFGSPQLPPAVMLRSVDRAPVKGADSGKPCRVDMFRDEPLLGWDTRYPSFIKAVMEARSHHYDMFNGKNIKQVTAQINEALEILGTIGAVGT
ncbi:Alpha/Beta hydrolase protein [Podospora appendiculata]|uniref:Alpha/Beta hydrolase protein n=1 Tax=Podospora appendiculata TaxID=314037 RepID=A0AAE1CAA0_9PEZI|nr:Alpha/Beta hydrolase protein [Podospora appendiculata]